MAETPPETPTQAARVLIGWFAGGLAFQSVETFASGSNSSAIGYGIAAVIVAIADYKLKWLLSGNPNLTASLNRAAADARWWIGAAMVSLLMITFSPYIEEGRLPFSARQWIPSALRPHLPGARSLTRDEKQRFTDTLKFAVPSFNGKTIRVLTMAEAMCSDCQDFRIELRDLINSVPGWESPSNNAGTVGSSIRNPYGLVLSIYHNKDTTGSPTGSEAFALALHAADLEFEIVDGFPGQAFVENMPAICVMVLPPQKPD